MTDQSYTIELIEGADGTDPDDDNVDVIVRFADGAVYAATFFTRANLATLMQRYRETGECASGLYLWAANMIIVARLDRATVDKTVADLLASGEFGSAFARSGG